MPMHDLSDLVVLAATAKGPITISRISAVAKALVPEVWSPTIDVVETAVDRNLVAGNLRPNGHENAGMRVELTEDGRRRVSELLSAEPELSGCEKCSAWTTLQLCCLDLADEQTVSIALERLTRKVADDIRRFRNRCAMCPHDGRFTRAWLDMEHHRLETMARMLAEASETFGTVPPAKADEIGATGMEIEP